jgi:type IV secretory pathway VirB10-like protein
MSYQEKYLKYKSKYLNLIAEIHNNDLENRIEQNGGNLDILNVDQLSGTVSITEKKYLMLGGSKESDLDLPDKLTETPVSEDKSTSDEKPKSSPVSEDKSTSEEKPIPTPVSEDKSTSEEKPIPTPVSEDKPKNSHVSKDKPKKVDDDSSSEHESNVKNDSETHSSESLSPSSSEEIKQKGGKKDVKKIKKSSWFSDSELVSTDTTFMSFSTLDTSSESDL